MHTLPQPHAPTPLEVEQSKTLLALLEGQAPIALTVQGQPYPLPATLTALLTDIVRQTARGQSVVVLPPRSELSSQDAADYLGVSRQYLVGEADAGGLAYRKVGTHRRFALSEVLSYGERMRQSSLEARQELADEAQRLERIDGYKRMAQDENFKTDSFVDSDLNAGLEPSNETNW